jgi:hypothetical protein
MARATAKLTPKAWASAVAVCGEVVASWPAWVIPPWKPGSRADRHDRPEHDHDGQRQDLAGQATGSRRLTRQCLILRGLPVIRMR